MNTPSGPAGQSGSAVVVTDPKYADFVWDARYGKGFSPEGLAPGLKPAGEPDPLTGDEAISSEGSSR